MIDRNLSGARDSVLERRPGQLRNGGAHTALLGSQKISAALNTDASRETGREYSFDYAASANWSSAGNGSENSFLGRTIHRLN
jgi:hypothetical protein